MRTTCDWEKCSATRKIVANCGVWSHHCNLSHQQKLFIACTCMIFGLSCRDGSKQDFVINKAVQFRLFLSLLRNESSYTCLLKQFLFMSLERRKNSYVGTEDDRNTERHCAYRYYWESLMSNPRLQGTTFGRNCLQPGALDPPSAYSMRSTM